MAQNKMFTMCHRKHHGAQVLYNVSERLRFSNGVMSSIFERCQWLFWRNQNAIFFRVSRRCYWTLIFWDVAGWVFSDVSKNRSAFTFPEDMNFQEITTPTDQRSEYSVLCLIPTILQNLILLSMGRYIYLFHYRSGQVHRASGGSGSQDFQTIGTLMWQSC